MPVTRNPERRPGAGLIESALWSGVLVGLLATELLIWGGSAAATELLVPQRWVWWRALQPYYLGGSLIVGGLLALSSRLVRGQRIARWLLQVLAAVVLVVVLWLDRVPLESVLTSGQGASGSGWIAIGAVLGLVGLGVVASGGLWTRPWLTRSILLALAGGSGWALARGGADGADRPVSFGPAANTLHDRLLVIGLDGADWDFIEPLIAKGDLPHLAALRDRGAWGELETMRPTRSAPIWTSVVTGVEPKRHGVVNNSVERLRGSFRRLPGSLELPRGLGLDWIVETLRWRGRIAPSTVASFDRRVPAFWTIATVNESPVDFVNWWASWPAEQVFGRMVSDRIHFWRLRAKGFAVGEDHITYPDSLSEDLEPLVMRPDQVTREQVLEFMDISEREFEEMKTTPYRHHLLKSEFKYLYSMYVTNLRIALELLDSGRGTSGPAPDLFVLFRIIDQASHQALQYSELVADHLGSSDEEVAKYGRVVSEAYRAADRAVGMLVEAFGEGNIVILSDHGFELATRKRRQIYDHVGGNPPAGILIAAGEGLAGGPVEGLSVYDMMPLFLYLKGWPVAADFVSDVPTALITAERLARQPVERRDSYGEMTVSLPEEGGLVADDEMVERLRALGYLD